MEVKILNEIESESTLHKADQKLWKSFPHALLSLD